MPGRARVALAFDDATARLAVLVRYLWSDCSWTGDGLRLYVFDVHTGDRLHQRDLAQRAGHGPFGLGFAADTIVSSEAPARAPASGLFHCHPDHGGAGL